MGAKYIGTEAGRIRIEDVPVKPGDVITGPPDVVAALLERGDFEDDGRPAEGLAGGEVIFFPTTFVAEQTALRKVLSETVVPSLKQALDAGSIPIPPSGPGESLPDAAAKKE